MVTKEKFKTGICMYVEKELVPKVGGIRKWMLLLGAMELVNSLDSYLKKMEATSYMQADGMIDIDRLYADLHPVAEKTGPVTEHIPLIGDVTFNARDIEILYQYILG